MDCDEISETGYIANSKSFTNQINYNFILITCLSQYFLCCEFDLFGLAEALTVTDAKTHTNSFGENIP
jgi:hypothetical protein